MSKKGAHSSGGGKGRLRERNQRMAANLPPSPARWRARPHEWPYHNNLGARHRRRKGVTVAP